jgi:hypothetical protein
MLFDPFESAVLFLAVIIVNQGEYRRHRLKAPSKMLTRELMSFTALADGRTNWM